MRQVLFLHGAPGDARVWSSVIDRLPPQIDARAITLSLFGTAACERGGEAFGTELHADDILAYVAASMVSPVDVVAWSYAVHPTLLAALNAPELFGRLFLYEPGLPTYVSDPGDLAGFEKDAGKAFGPISAALRSGGNDAAVAALIDSSGGEGTFATLPADRQAIYLDSAGMMPLLMGEGQPPAAIQAGDLARLTLPVTVVMGADTRAVFAIPSRTLAAALPAGKLLKVEDADHMLPETDAARFAGLIAAWLEEGGCG